MVQRSVESSATSSTNIQQSVFASIDSVPAFSATAAREQEQSRQHMPRLAELQVSSPSAGKTSAASKKKLMSMAFQAQKQRRETAAAAAAAAATAAEVSSNADTVSSSDTDTSPARGRDCLAGVTSRVVDDLTSDDIRQPQADDSCMSEQCDAGSFQPATDTGCQLCNSSVEDDTDAASLARSVNAGAMTPKTLTPAKALPASLMAAAADSDDPHPSIDVLSSPIKLVPPADPQRIHAIVTSDTLAITSDETVQPDTDVAE